MRPTRYLRIDAARAPGSPSWRPRSQRPDLWDDQDRAKQVNAAVRARRGTTWPPTTRSAPGLEDVEVLHELAREEDDESQEPEIEAAVRALDAQLDELELRSLFTGEHDEADAICRINAKDGGVDAQDWAEMLLRMYTRWAERRGFDVEVDDVSEGTEAGILSAEFTIRGRYAYGLMPAERGTHRLVRISPFDGNARRQTSFAAVEVWPILDDVGDGRASTTRRSGSTPTGRREPAASTSTRRRRPSGSRTCPPAWWSPARTSAASSRTGRRRMHKLAGHPHCHGRGGAGGRAAAHRRRQAGAGGLGEPDPQLRAPAVPDGEGPAHRARGGQRRGCLDGDIDGFMEAFLRFRRTGSTSD